MTTVSSADDEPKPPAGLLEDIKEYVDALRASADRSRYALYVALVTTTLVFIANYNIQPDNWPIRRLDTWFHYARGTKLEPIPPQTLGHGDAQRLSTIRDEYAKQFAAHSVFTASPIPGVTIDVNDLGVIGGVALTMVMLVLATCIVREHENVYLALYKVRVLCEQEAEARSHGNSRSNLLYHALAMNQVLSSPPTLARWQRHGGLYYFRFIFLLPAVIYAWVCWTNWRTADKALIYGIDIWQLLSVQAVLLYSMFGLSITALLHSRAMAQRWEQAFFRINPQRRVAAQMNLAEWLRLPFFVKRSSHAEQHLATQAVDRIRVASQLSFAHIPVVRVSPLLNHPRVEVKDRRGMTEAVYVRGRMGALYLCDQNDWESPELLEFELYESVIREGRWWVSGRWRFSFTPRREKKSLGIA
jgi:hypothetical protein